MKQPTYRDLAIALRINESAVPRLLEVYRRGGVRGGAPDGDGGKDDKGGKEGGGDKGDPDPAAAAAKEAAALKERAEKAEKLLADRTAADEAAKKKAAEDDAKKRGDFDKLAAEKDAEIAKLKAQADRGAELEKASRTRVDAMIAKLPDEAKKEVDLVKDALSLEKLEAFVWAKAEAAGTGGGLPPAPGVGGRRGKDDSHELHKETKMVLRRLSAPREALEIGSMLGKFDRDGDPVFRFRGTGDDEKDTESFIGFMNSIAVNPVREISDERMKRIREAAKGVGA